MKIAFPIHISLHCDLFLLISSSCQEQQPVIWFVFLSLIARNITCTCSSFFKVGHFLKVRLHIISCMVNTVLLRYCSFVFLFKHIRIYSKDKVDED